MMSSDSSPPILHINDAVATITLNRPAQRNRLENGDLQILLQHVMQINADLRLRVVVLTAGLVMQKRLSAGPAAAAMALALANHVLPASAPTSHRPASPASESAAPHAATDAT